jgi:hypothetical protein
MPGVSATICDAGRGSLRAAAPLSGGKDETCPLSTGGRTRRVQLVQGEVVSSGAVPLNAREQTMLSTTERRGLKDAHKGWLETRTSKPRAGRRTAGSSGESTAPPRPPLPSY